MKFLPYLLPLLLLFAACTEPFEVAYQSIEPKLVVDAVVTDAPNGSLVLLTRSVSLATPATAPTVSDAVVTLTSGTGATYTASLLDSGAYAFAGFAAQPGETYTLHVQDGENAYSATSTLAQSLVLDTVTFEFRPPSPPVMDEGYIARVHFSPTLPGQCFRFRLFVNDTMSSTIFLYDGVQGGSEPGAYAFRRETVPAGATVRIRAEAIDKQVYAYYSQLSDLADSGSPLASSATPANPTTNLSGDALGVFALMGVSEIVVKAP